MLRKIAITGPDSDAKAELAALLAEAYKTYWVPDVASGYSAMIGRPFVEKDIEIIARQQLQQEDELAKISTGFLFCASEMLSLKIWSEQEFHRVHPLISSQLRQRKYHLYILSDCDSSEDKISIRGKTEDKNYFCNWYLRELQLMQVKFVQVKGTNEEQVKKIISLLG